MRSTLLYLIIIVIFGQQTKCSAEEVITNPKQSDGFGSQFQTIIASVIYAELHNKKYLYTPFEIMEHNYDKDPDFIAKKEWLINFIDNFECINSNKNYTINAKSNCKEFFDKNVSICAQSLALQKIKNIFRANKDIHHYFNNENFNIAIHVRRPNPHDNRLMGSDTPDKIFLNIIKQLRVVYSCQSPLFHLYSQGSSDNFTVFTAQDVVLHLNESVEDTFCAMVLADVLVTAASSLSYTAGLLSEGIVYYIPFWHTPLLHWISVDMLLKKQ